MRINLWYCKEMNYWRWTLMDNRLPICKQKSGQHSDLRNAMSDIASAVEYMLQSISPG
jgi:hypothetical protein